ncbi:hypothetical protein [Pelomonas sp. KK5]|uniref:hypothetical protein n=1 Tax=Pelomonas sp. KK5 TaxID=1855730 RepID=UPI00097C3C3F|nr:hypothetical protein [Pelomonas sp. KK5]
MSKPARISGPVSYREGEGQPIEIPLGPCEVEIGELDATISWIEGDAHGLTAIPLADFRRFVSQGDIELPDAG